MRRRLHELRGLGSLDRYIPYHTTTGAHPFRRKALGSKDKVDRARSCRPRVHLFFLSFFSSPRFLSRAPRAKDGRARLCSLSCAAASRFDFFHLLFFSFRRRRKRFTRPRQFLLGLWRILCDTRGGKAFRRRKCISVQRAVEFFVVFVFFFLSARAV